MNRLFFKIYVLLFCFVSGCLLSAKEKQETNEADVVVYGDASGGVMAAVQAARMGKSVILVSQYGHLGGMTSNGLDWTDIGNDAILGGLSRGIKKGQRVTFNLTNSRSRLPLMECHASLGLKATADFTT